MSRAQRFQTETIPGGLARAVDNVNAWGLAPYVFNFYGQPGGEQTVIVWQFTDYPGYRYWCEVRGFTPLTVEQFYATPARKAN